MSFNVRFYSFPKEVNSSKLPSGNGTVIPCVANDGVDIINPVISLQRGFGGANSPTAWNYCKIDDFSNRYYFIENWEWRGGLWHAHCTVDVLATYRSQIYNMSAYVVRSAYEYDGTISDALYPGRELFERFTLPYNSPWVSTVWNGTVVVCITGNGGNNFYKFTYQNFLSFVEALLSDAYVRSVVSDWGFDYYSETKAIVDPLQYVTSVIYIPLSDETGMAEQTLKIGFGTVTATCKSMNLGSDTVTTHNSFIENIPEHPWARFKGEYLNFAPWSSYSLYIPPFGNIEIDPSSFNGRIKLVYSVDWATGDLILQVWGQEPSGNEWRDTIIMNVLKGKLGVTIQIGQVVAPGMGVLSNVQHGANLVSQVMGGITGGGGTGGMIANQLGAGGGVSGVVGTIGSLIGGAASAVSGGAGWIRDSIESKIPHLNTTGSLGSFVEYVKNITLSVKCVYPMIENREQRGRPLCTTRRLGDLAADIPETGSTNIFHSGYMVIADPDVNNIAATASERIMIVNFMTGGFFLA